MSLRPPAPHARLGARPGSGATGWWHYEYWMAVAILAVAGILAAFTVGMAFLILAGALAAAAPFRGNRPAFWAIVGGTLAFLASFILLAPDTCSSAASSSLTSSGAVSQFGSTVCRNLVGMSFTHADGSSPSLLPSLLVALAAPALVAAAGAVLVRRRRGPRAGGVPNRTRGVTRPETGQP